MNPSKIQPGWFSIPQAAYYAGFSASSIRKAMRGGKLPARKVALEEGSTAPAVRISRADLDAWLNSQPLTTEPKA